MKIKLIRAARIRHNAGEVVDASPAEAGYLISTGCAVAFTEPKAREIPEMVTAENPEAAEAAENPEEAAAAETPEKPKRQTSRRTAAKK